MQAQKKLLAFSLSVISVSFLIGTAQAALPEPLAPPFDAAAVRLKTGGPDKKKFSCDSPPAPMVDLHMESFYKKDGTASIVDPAAYAAYKKAKKPVSQFEIGLQSMGNRYVRSNPPRADVAGCALSWLATWAEEEALMGDVNKNGEYTRSWLLGSLASAWLQIRDEPSLDASKREEVTAWIRKVADAVREDFSRDTELKSRRNNHLYWAAWGVGAAGIALNDKPMFDWALEKTRAGIGAIQADGTLPLEMARGQRAYLYHLFAAMPLFMMANAAEKNNVDLFSENGAALQRLGALCLKNLDEPEFFEEKTGKTQDLTRVGTPSDLGWVEIYRQHYNDPLADAVLKDFRPLKQSRFGGNITLLYGQTLVKKPKPQ
jgi:poly(beta-D-mannuronate) lyase